MEEWRIGLYQRITPKPVNFPLAGFENDCNVVCDKPAVNPVCVPAYKYPWQKYYPREGKFTGNIDIRMLYNNSLLLSLNRTIIGLRDQLALHEICSA